MGVGKIKIITNLEEILKSNRDIEDKMLLININRIFYLTILSVTMRVLMLGIFFLKSPTGDETQMIWRRGMLIVHLIYLLIMLILAIASSQLRKKPKVNLYMSVVQYTALMTILFLSILIVSLDQLITLSISPFLLACIASGLIFLIKPLYSLIIYLIVYLIYFFMMGITQTEVSILLSNRINGLTVSSLGWLLSFILWRYSVMNFQQKSYIEYQKQKLEEKNKELKELARLDFLTNLINRRHFEERAREEIGLLGQSNSQICFLILDIDNFKEINDKYGHPTGDALLRKFSALLKSQLKEKDIISRIGGEEFALLLLDTDARQGILVGEKIRKRVEDEDFIINGQTIKITVSIGIAPIRGKSASYREGYRVADRALYNVKARGKNGVEIIL